MSDLQYPTDFIRWDRTDIGRLRLWLDERLERGYYLGHHLIGRDTAIDKGVYIGHTSREAILVDFEASPLLQKYYQEAKERCEAIQQCRHPPFLEAIYSLVPEKMKYSEEETARLVRQLNVKEDGLISLERFVEEGFGVCRQQALFGGVLIEKAIEEGIFRGRVSADRNSISTMGHAWDRVTSPAGKVYILNLSPKTYIGTLQDSVTEAKGRLFCRPEDEEWLGLLK